MAAFSAFSATLIAVWWAHTAGRLADLNALTHQELEDRVRLVLAREELDVASSARLALEHIANEALESGRLPDSGGPYADLTRLFNLNITIAALDREGRVVVSAGDPSLVRLASQLHTAKKGSIANRKHFFSRYGGLVQVMSLPIRTRSPATGTGIVLLPWDHSRIARLEEVLGARIRLVGPRDPLPEAAPGTDRVEISDIFQDADGRILARLAIEVDRPRLLAHRSAISRNAALYAVFNALGIILLGFLLRTMVCQPVSLILEAIRRRSPSSLDHLATQQTDMGELARLVQEFFRKEAELQQETDRLRQSREELKRLYAAIEHSPDTIVITDLSGSIIYANPGFEKVTGYSREEALGKNPRILKSGLHGCDFYKNMWASLLSQGYWSGEITNRRKNGSLYIEYAAISRIQSPDGEPIGYVAVKTDITERKRAEFELRRHATELEQARDQLVAQARELTVARDRALEAVKARSEFLSRISHELRTPLNGIIGMLDVLMLTGLSQEQYECASAAVDSAKKLLTILTDIIEFSRLESETLELCEEETGLREILEEAWDSCREEAAQKGIRLAVTVEDGVPGVVSVDRQKLLQALDQLCRNAVKFTVEGEASLRVSLTETRRGPALRFEVADTGVGIPAERLEGLFEPFHQPEQFSTRRFRGTGLGLAIVRKLVEFWGGEVGVESEPGKGSRFHFTVPLKQAGQRAA